MSFEHKVALTIDGESKAYLEVLFTEHESKPDEFSIVVRKAEGGPIQGQAAWHVAEIDGTFTLQVSSQTIGIGICLAGCFAEVISGPLVDCLRKAKNRAAVRQCIKHFGVSQAISTLACVYGCLDLQG